MIKTLLTLVTAGLILVGCGDSSPAGPKTVNYDTITVTCKDMSEPLILQEDEKTDLRFYRPGDLFNVDVHDNKKRLLKEQYYWWVGNCNIKIETKEVVIDPEISTEKPL